MPSGVLEGYDTQYQVVSSSAAVHECQPDFDSAGGQPETPFFLWLRGSKGAHEPLCRSTMFRALIESLICSGDKTEYVSRIVSAAYR